MANIENKQFAKPQKICQCYVLAQTCDDTTLDGVAFENARLPHSAFPFTGFCRDTWSPSIRLFSAVYSELPADSDPFCCEAAAAGA